MKNEKLLFNQLLIQYNRCTKKLNSLATKGLNFRKQNIIARQLRRLQLRLNAIGFLIGKNTGLACMVVGFFVIQPFNSDAQNFNAALTNPFSLTGAGEASNSTFADTDGDGDMDMLSGSYNGNFYYYENEGTQTNPSFGSIQTNPFSLSLNSEYWTYPSFVDIDNDGDFDIFSGGYNGNFYFFENIGSSISPLYETAVANPFSLVYVGLHSTPAFTDLDNDGDFDLISGELYGDFFYFENTGNSTEPAFAPAVINPFSLTNISLSSKPTAIDYDGDGDIDLVAGNSDADFIFYKNTGSNILPNFNAPVTNPNGLSSTGELSAPTFADLDGDNDQDLMSGNTDGNFYYFKKNCNNVNTSINLEANVLSANQPNANYQWIDCNNSNQLIVGETNQSFTATETGSYSAEISIGGCTAITNCFDVTVCNGATISSNITLNGNTLIADQNDATYQWIDCNNSNSPIEGEINQSFLTIDTGSYAVEIGLNGCTTTSNCFNVTGCNGSSIATNITSNGGTLTSDQNGAFYQWLDCNGNLPIEGETNQFFTPASSGNYALQITLDGCFVTTDCINISLVGTEEITAKNDIRIYPNPTNQFVSVLLNKPLKNGRIQIKSIAGNLIFERKNIFENSFTLDLSSASSGLYFLEIFENGNSNRYKIIKN